MMPFNVYHPPQNRCRPLALIALASCTWTNLTLAQDTAPAANPSGTDAPAVPVSGGVKRAAKPGGETSGTSGQTPNGKPNNPFRTGESTRGDGTGKRSPFAYDAGGADEAGPKSSRKTGGSQTDAETEKTGAQSESREGAESQFVAPGFYGRAPQVITPGKGQYARPKFRYGVSVGFGYNDNPDQVPTVNLGAVARPRVRTGYTWLNGHWDAQWLRPTTVFTVSVETGGDFYWDRPGRSTDFNGRIGLVYVNKLNPRTQLSANASLAYLTQPDYSNLFASSNQVSGDYFTGSTKFDLNYRWTPHFSTTTSASVNLLKYVNDSAGKLSNSFWDFTFGNEFRFQSSSRLTWVAEGRYGIDEYLNNTPLNSQTAYFLGGLDWIASRHFTGTIRTGASIRSYDVGGSNAAPYAELSLNYVTGRHSALSVNGRYGFEQSTSAGDKNLSYRIGLAYQLAITSRLSGNAGLNFVHTDYNPRTGAHTSTDVYDMNAGLQYRLDRHFSLGARYSYTLQDSSTGLQNFDQNRFIFTVQYEY